MQYSCNEIFLIISYLFVPNFLSISILARSSFIDGFRFWVGGGVVSFFSHFFSLSFFSFLRIPPVAFIEEFWCHKFLSFPYQVNLPISKLQTFVQSTFPHVVVVGNTSHGCGRGPCRKPSVHDAFSSAGRCEPSQQIKADKLPEQGTSTASLWFESLLHGPWVCEYFAKIVINRRIK